MEGNLCVCFFFAEHPTSLFSPQKGARVKSKQNEKLIFNAAFQAFKTGSWRTVLSSNGSVFFLNDVNPLLTAVVWTGGKSRSESEWAQREAPPSSPSVFNHCPS